MIYIAGPMSGISDFNFPEFERAAKELRTNGYTAVSPHEIGDSTKSWESNMAICIMYLMECDSIFLLKGWENSKGAGIEYEIARLNGMKIMKECD
jgi:hypothetical protein